MSYPQPSADSAVVTSQQFFRLNTPMVSAGDTYRLTQSAYGFAVGPDSDIALVNLSYFDPNAPGGTSMNQVTISPESPFIGEMQCRRDQSYQPTGVQANIIVSPANIIPQLANNQASPSQNIVVQPVMDVIQYLAQPPTGLPTKRHDKEFNFMVGQTTGYTAGKVIIYIPIYGRKRFMVIANDFQGSNGSLVIQGMTYPPGIGTAGFTQFSGGAPTTLLTSTSLGGATLVENYSAAANGQFDWLQLQFTNTSTDMVMLKTIVSDTP